MARRRETGLYGGGDLTTIPDPSALTDAAISRAQDRFDLAIRDLREIIEARLTAIDLSMTHQREYALGLREQTERIVAHLQVLHDEKFTSISSKFDERNVWLHEKFDGLNKQFTERDVRTDQATRAGKDALDAALKAASELVTQQNTANVAAAAKSETSFTKQIDQIATIISTLEKALDSRITELKERIDRGEGASQGGQHVTTEQRLNASQGTQVMISVVIGLALLVSIISVIAFVLKK